MEGDDRAADQPVRRVDYAHRAQGRRLRLNRAENAERVEKAERRRHERRGAAVVPADFGAGKDHRKAGMRQAERGDQPGRAGSRNDYGLWIVLVQGCFRTLDGFDEV
jgi:hypothetical protein